MLISSNIFKGLNHLPHDNATPRQCWRSIEVVLYLSLCASIDYLCYGSTTIIKTLILSVRGRLCPSESDVYRRRPIRQILMCTVGHRVERVTNLLCLLRCLYDQASQTRLPVPLSPCSAFDGGVWSTTSLRTSNQSTEIPSGTPTNLW